ncbi:MAG: hypothetical protein MI919_23280 [Holophagales bacterium]|nr:hypothetical protein [Holophagales bacterium]
MPELVTEGWQRRQRACLAEAAGRERLMEDLIEMEATTLRNPEESETVDREKARSSGPAWSVPRVAHLLAGIGTFYAFGRTGLFMDQQLDHLVGMPDGPRALFRSGHIYLLWSALVHGVLGLYLVPARWLPARLAQHVGSLFLFLSVAFLLYGFYVETPLGRVERPGLRHGIYLSLAGVALHGLGSLVLERASGLWRGSLMKGAARIAGQDDV